MVHRSLRSAVLREQPVNARANGNPVLINWFTCRYAPREPIAEHDKFASIIEQAHYQRQIRPLARAL